MRNLGHVEKNWSATCIYSEAADYREAKKFEYALDVFGFYSGLLRIKEEEGVSALCEVAIGISTDTLASIEEVTEQKARRLWNATRKISLSYREIHGAHLIGYVNLANGYTAAMRELYDL